jgi:glycosyltransferase involved in cell wall biosynthesis
LNWDEPVTVRPDRATPRVALVAPGPDILGGQWVQADALQEGLRAAGYRISFVRIDPVFPRRLRWLRRLPLARTLINELLYLPSLRRLRDADVVHVFSASYWSFLLAAAPALLISRLLGKRVILNYHSGEAEDHLAHWGVRVHPWLRLADEIVVPSEYLREVFARFGYRARVIRNVVDTARFHYRERRPLRPRLLSIRNLEPHYRVDVTLRSFGLLKTRYPEASLLIAGYGSEEARLRLLASSLGLEGIRFVGRVEPDAVPLFYDAADVFINSAVVDNQPVSVLEAFAAGLAVVSTGTGDIAAMLRHGEAGRVVPAEDPAAIAEAISDLLENPRRALRQVRRAKQEVERYTWSRVQGDWASVYQGARP